MKLYNIKFEDNFYIYYGPFSSNIIRIDDKGYFGRYMSSWFADKDNQL